MSRWKERFRTDSIETILRMIMGIQLFVVSGLLLVFLLFTVSRAAQESQQMMDNLLDVYAEGMNDRFDDIQHDMIRVMQDDTDLARMSSEDHNARVMGSVAIRSILADIVNYGDGAEGYAVYEHTYANYVAGWAENIKNYALKRDAEEWIRSQGRDVGIGWKFVEFGGEQFAVLQYHWENRTVAAFLDVNAMLAALPAARELGYCVALTDSEENLRAVAGEPLVVMEEDMRASEIESRSLRISSREIGGGQMYCYMMQHRVNLVNQLRGSSVFIFLTILTLLLAGITFSRVIEKMVLRPLEDMVHRMDAMKGGNLDIRLQGEGNVRELALTADTFNHLMDDIMQLKIESYQKQLDLAEAEEKYIRLQIKPHFFLNALTTISGLSRKKRNDDIEVYISSLNKNIRYMFSSGLHTVSCREELEHVENYFEMQELKYPGMVFYFVDLPEELGDWQIPQMIVHTIVENAYKYAVADGSLLSVYIKIDRRDRGGQDMLCIEIEDDGPGYPESVLDYMKGKGDRDDSDGRRVGLWSLKRMLELMYDREDLMEVENSEMNGAVCRFYIPEKPVHERVRATRANQGIR